MQIPVTHFLAFLFLIVLSVTPSPVLADRRDSQVQIESKIVEVNNSQVRELGVDWNQSAETAQMRSLQHLDQPGNFAAANNVFDFKPLDFFAPQSTPPKVVSAPKIQVQNNEPAKIQAPMIIPVVPQIQNDGKINLNIIPEIQSNGMINMKVLPEQQNLTTVQVPDGNTVLLGGLTQEKPADNSKAPLLGTIPMIGSLFRNQSDQKIKKDLTVLVTPTIIQPSDN